MFKILILFFMTKRHTKLQRNNKGTENPNKPTGKYWFFFSNITAP